MVSGGKMEIITFLFMVDTALFTICLLLAVMGSLFSMLGIADGDADDLSLDIDNIDPSFLGWLGFGKVPLLIISTCLLFFFGGLGLILQFLILSFGVNGILLPWILVSLVVIMPTLMLTKIAGDAFIKYLPNLENYAHNSSELIGKSGVVTMPNIAPGSACELRIDIVGRSAIYVRVRSAEIKAINDIVTIGSYDPKTYEYVEQV
jgi:hypothetical protein